MSARKSLQDLAREAASPFTDHLTLHYLRLQSRGKLNVSHGAAIKHLQQVGALDANRQFTPRAQLTLKGMRDEQDKKARSAKRARKEKSRDTLPSPRKKRDNSASASEDGTDSSA